MLPCEPQIVLALSPDYRLMMKRAPHSIDADSAPEIIDFRRDEISIQYLDLKLT